MVRRIVAAGVVALLLLSRPALAQSSAPPLTGLTVKGTATVEQKPDLAELTLSVLTRGPSLDAASSAHEARLAQARPVLDRLRAEGVSVDQGAFSLAEERPPVAPGGRPGNEPPTYRAETRYDLSIRPLGRIDAIVAEVVSAGLFDLGSVRFAVAEKGDAVDRARRAAMADARHQAEIYADAGGLRLDGIVRVVDGDVGGPDGALDLPVAMSRSASVGIIPPKALDFQGSVVVTWHVVLR